MSRSIQGAIEAPTCGEPDQNRTLSVLIAQELASRMADHCRCNGVDMSRAVAQAIDLYLERCHLEEQQRNQLELSL